MVARRKVLQAVGQPFFEQVVRTWHPGISGDVEFVLRPYWLLLSSRTGTTHGSPYDYDTHVPLIFYGWNIKHGQSMRPVYITDVAPTVSALLKIPYPNGATGNPLPELFEK